MTATFFRSKNTVIGLVLLFLALLLAVGCSADNYVAPARSTIKDPYYVLWLAALVCGLSMFAMMIGIFLSCTYFLVNLDRRTKLHIGGLQSIPSDDVTSEPYSPVELIQQDKAVTIVGGQGHVYYNRGLDVSEPDGQSSAFDTIESKPLEFMTLKKSGHETSVI